MLAQAGMQLNRAQVTAEAGAPSPRPLPRLTINSVTTIPSIVMGIRSRDQSARIVVGGEELRSELSTVEASAHVGLSKLQVIH
jgi:hypothetical protein